MGSYLGHKIALRLLGAKDSATAFDGRRFPSLPLYRGKPWFMPLVYGYYYWRDRVSRGDGFAGRAPSNIYIDGPVGRGRRRPP